MGILEKISIMPKSPQGETEIDGKKNFFWLG